MSSHRLVCKIRENKRSYTAAVYEVSEQGRLLVWSANSHSFTHAAVEMIHYYVYTTMTSPGEDRALLAHSDRVIERLRWRLFLEYGVVLG